MKNGLIYFGMLLAVGFGASFIIYLLRDGDFYIAEFTTSIIGAFIILTGLFLKKEIKSDKTS
jgi:membrane-bound metal-dependent hydrolase YbcI (DUF457 family)